MLLIIMRTPVDEVPLDTLFMTSRSEKKSIYQESIGGNATKVFSS